MTQRFLESGDYAPVSVLEAITNTVVDKKTVERDHYCALQVGAGNGSEGDRPQVGADDRRKWPASFESRLDLVMQCAMNLLYRVDRPVDRAGKTP